MNWWITDLQAAFRYEPDTGRLISRRNGREITGPNRRTDLKAPYATAKFKGKLLVATHIIWALTHGEWPGNESVVDHINGDTHDNRLINLRLLSRKANMDYHPKHLKGLDLLS